MSIWSYITGTITVNLFGRTQPECRYILDTVLSHLPRVTGSEGDMHVYTIQKDGYNCSSSCDEFGQRSDKAIDWYGKPDQRNGMFRTQEIYIIVIDGALRDREFNETYRQFCKWLTRLAKRIWVKDVLVRIESYSQSSLIENHNSEWGEILEDPSWFDGNTARVPLPGTVS